VFQQNGITFTEVRNPVYGYRLPKRSVRRRIFRAYPIVELATARPRSVTAFDITSTASERPRTLREVFSSDDGTDGKRSRGSDNDGIKESALFDKKLEQDSMEILKTLQVRQEKERKKERKKKREETVKEIKKVKREIEIDDSP
jgi:hypothetical protein